ncbi:MAG: hypothetical protein DME75_12330 [Verrucomicrobia bacterium]|nr:MAG: hypothetical protein DME75_12330 [Verrucomicrobiota bacterium]
MPQVATSRTAAFTKRVACFQIKKLDAAHDHGQSEIRFIISFISGALTDTSALAASASFV